MQICAASQQSQSINFANIIHFDLFNITNHLLACPPLCFVSSGQRIGAKDTSLPGGIRFGRTCAGRDASSRRSFAAFNHGHRIS
jgi:hypothetical protein